MSSQVLEATIKIRDGKKWKKRFCVLQRASSDSSSVSELALLDVYKNAKIGHKPGQKKRVIRLENFYGLESGFGFDKESHTLAIICSNLTVLAFDTDSELRSWELWLRNYFGHGCQYSVLIVEAPLVFSTIINSTARLHLRDKRFCLVVDSPPKFALELNFCDIRRYGAFDNKFYVEVGSRAGRVAGTYVFRSGHRDQMTFTFRLASSGELRRYLSFSDGGGNYNTSRSSMAESNAPLTSNVSHQQCSSIVSQRDSYISASDNYSSSSTWNDRKPLVQPTKDVVPKNQLAYSNEVFDSNESNCRKIEQTQLSDQVSFHAELSSFGSEVTKQPLQSASQPSDQQTKLNYENESFLRMYTNTNSDSLDNTLCYFDQCDQSKKQETSSGAVILPGYMAMMPNSYNYERMESSVTEGFAGTSAVTPLSTPGQETSSSSFVKPFEPLIVPRKKSDTLLNCSLSVKNDRKFSLPAALLPRTPEPWYVRRFSLEENRAQQSSPASLNGHRIVEMFRSTGVLAKDALRNGSARARSFFDSIMRKNESATPSKVGDGESDDGRQSRAYSEPPIGTMIEREQQLHGILEGHDFVPSKSSLDLDEVEFDVGSIRSADQLPSCLLRKIGIKPLIPENNSTMPCSSVKLPVCPTKSISTDSTQSTNSMRGALAGHSQFGRNSYTDSIVSVGSDSSESDNVFQDRPVRKKLMARAINDTAKSCGKLVAGRDRLLPATPIRKEIPTSTLGPLSLSDNAKRRLRENLTKPLTGCYSQYDGSSSRDSQPKSPFSNVNSLTPSTVGNRSRMPTLQERQDLGDIESRGRHPLREPQSRPSHNRSSVNSKSYSPPPPTEPAPSPPGTSTGIVQRLPPLTAQSSLEGHRFKFPSPAPILNYAMLAAQEGTSPATPAFEISSWRSSKSALSIPREVHSVEYAKIDQMATRAAREVSTSRLDEMYNRWSSSHTIMVGGVSSAQGPSSSASTSKSRHRFSFKRTIRRRISVASFSGT